MQIVHCRARFMHLFIYNHSCTTNQLLCSITQRSYFVQSFNLFWFTFHRLAKAYKSCSLALIIVTSIALHSLHRHNYFVRCLPLIFDCFRINMLLFLSVSDDFYVCLRLNSGSYSSSAC